jgi:FkbM family methyltransferase
VKLLSASTKQWIRQLINRCGYSLQSIDRKSAINGIDLINDIKSYNAHRQNPVVFDVGANEGQTIDWVTSALPTCEIHAFEPSPSMFASLLSRYGGKRGIHLHNVALGREPGTLPFYVTTHHSVNDSLLKPLWKEQAKIVNVSVTTLDEICTRLCCAQIDFLKIDVQGFDLEVLRGAQNLLSRRVARLVCVETSFSRMYEKQATFLDVVSAMNDFGYEICGFYERTYRNNQLIYCDTCFLPRFSEQAVDRLSAKERSCQ